MATDDEDPPLLDQTRDDDEPTTHQEKHRSKTARHVTRLVAEQVRPLLQTAVVEAVRCLKYEGPSFLPGFVTTRLADPFLALRNCVDESLLFERGIADISEAFIRHAAVDNSNKHRSLRRTLTGKPGVKLTSSGEQSNSSAGGELRKTLGTLDEQKRVAKIVTGEAERVALRLSVVTEAFVAQLTTLLGIRDRQRQMDMLTFAPYVLVHSSVARHASLSRLRLSDNVLITELGRAHARQFILFETFAQAYRIENAERRYDTLQRHADDWLAERFAPAVVNDMLPVDWFLDERTHEPLEEAVLSARRATMRRELPFLIIGVLHLMRFADERDSVIWSIYQKLI